jgi:hypothetical protein
MTTFETTRFAGADYNPERDNARLGAQLLRVWSVMSDGLWHTLPQIAQATGDPEASISAQLRHLRKDRFGAHTVEREYIRNGLYRYRLIINEGKEENT